MHEPYGVSRALPGPGGTQRNPGGTVGPRLIGASPVWAARSSYWRSQCTCFDHALERPWRGYGYGYGLAKAVAWPRLWLWP